MQEFTIQDVRHLMPMHKTKRWAKRDQSKITGICIHHSGIRPRTDGKHFDQIVAMANYHIHSQQLSKTGAPGYAYTITIDPKGSIYKCNAYTDITWHAGTTQANSQYIGVMLMGDFMLDKPTDAQMRSLREVIKIIRGALPGCWKVLGHREVKHSTECPGKNFTQEMVDALRSRG